MSRIVRRSLAGLLCVAACSTAHAQQDDPLVIPAPPVAPRYAPEPAYPARRAPADPGAAIANGIAGIVGGAAAVGGAIVGSAAGAFDAAATDANRAYRSPSPLPPCDPGEPPYDVAGRHVCRDF